VNAPDPIVASGFLLVAFTVAGLIQVAWLKSAASRRFARPIDGGRTMADGRRVFGDNKTWRGFLLMVPVCALVFGLLYLCAAAAGLGGGLWSLSPFTYALLGAWVGLTFMLAELPNSFLKRRFGVGPGTAPPPGPWRALCFLVDQTDSIFGGLLGLALVVPVPLTVWLAVLVLGLGIHCLFNFLLKHLGMKARAA